MSGTIINLIIQLIAGAIGGNAVGAAAKNVSLGTTGNTVAGARRRHRRRIAPDLADPDAVRRGGRHGHRRHCRPVGRRRRVRRDRLGDRRHGHEQHEERLSADLRDRPFRPGRRGGLYSSWDAEASASGRRQGARRSAASPGRRQRRRGPVRTPLSVGLAASIERGEHRLARGGVLRRNSDGAHQGRRPRLAKFSGDAVGYRREYGKGHGRQIRRHLPGQPADADPSGQDLPRPGAARPPDGVAPAFPCRGARQGKAAQVPGVALNADETGPLVIPAKAGIQSRVRALTLSCPHSRA